MSYMVCDRQKGRRSCGGVVWMFEIIVYSVCDAAVAVTRMY